MWTTIRELDRILRGEATRLANLRAGRIDVPIGGLSALLVVLAASKQFRAQTTQVRGIAKHLEERLLPPPPQSDVPFMAEIRRGKSGDLEVAGAVLQRAA